jgi:hypothetical protein
MGEGVVTRERKLEVASKVRSVCVIIEGLAVKGDWVIILQHDRISS